MSIFRLRGHHIRFVAGNLYEMPYATKYQRWLVDSAKSLMYTAPFAQKMKDLSVTICNSEIEIVSGIDDICKSGCPNLYMCQNGQYEEVRKKMFLKLLPLFFVVPNYVGNLLKPLNLDEDNMFLQEYGLEVGRTYTWAQIMGFN